MEEEVHETEPLQKRVESFSSAYEKTGKNEGTQDLPTGSGAIADGSRQ